LDLFFSAVVLTLTGMALIQLIRYFRQWRVAPQLSAQVGESSDTEATATALRSSAGVIRHLDTMYRLNKIEAAEYHRERSRLTETQVLQTQRDYLMQDLRDLELDHRMQKIDEADYLRERARLNPRAVAILKELASREDEVLDDDA